MEGFSGIFLILLICACMCWRAEYKEKKEVEKENYLRQISSQTQASLLYYNHQIMAYKQHIIMDLIKKDSPDSQPDYKLIEEHIKTLRYMYRQREKAIEDGKKKEDEAREIWK